jgi:hypothetical protein
MKNVRVLSFALAVVLSALSVEFSDAHNISTGWFQVR